MADDPVYRRYDMEAPVYGAFSWPSHPCSLPCTVSGRCMFVSAVAAIGDGLGQKTIGISMLVPCEDLPHESVLNVVLFIRFDLAVRVFVARG